MSWSISKVQLFHFLFKIRDFVYFRRGQWGRLNFTRIISKQYRFLSKAQVSPKCLWSKMQSTSMTSQLCRNMPNAHVRTQNKITRSDFRNSIFSRVRSAVSPEVLTRLGRVRPCLNRLDEPDFWWKIGDYVICTLNMFLACFLPIFLSAAHLSYYFPISLARIISNIL